MTSRFLSSKQILLRILTIIAVVEFTIMDAFIFMDLGLSPYVEAGIDVVLLSMLSTPLIYVVVINPYIKARDDLCDEILRLQDGKECKKTI